MGYEKEKEPGLCHDIMIYFHNVIYATTLTAFQNEKHPRNRVAASQHPKNATMLDHETHPSTTISHVAQLGTGRVWPLFLVAGVSLHRLLGWPWLKVFRDFPMEGI
jgi:hypothetical protein